MAVAAIDLTTLATVKTELGPSTPSTVDGLLQSIITACSRTLNTQCGRRLKTASVTKRFSGDATYGMALPNGPVTYVASVKIDGFDIPEIVDVGDVGYTLLNDRIELVGYIFTTGVANVEIQYTSGFTTVPEDLERACVELSCWVYQNRNHIGIQQRSVHDADAITFRKDEWPFLVRLTVDAYRTSMGVALFTGVEE